MKMQENKDEENARNEKINKNKTLRRRSENKKYKKILIQENGKIAEKERKGIFSSTDAFLTVTHFEIRIISDHFFISVVASEWHVPPHCFIKPLLMTN